MINLAHKALFSFAKQAKQVKKTKKVDEVVYNPFQGLKLVRAHALANFSESVVAQIKLNVDPRHGDQLVRGTCRMPYSLGSSKKLAIITSDPILSQKCLEQGADMALDAEMIEAIRLGGQVTFDKLIATPECMNMLKPAARFLGPMGLMPNLKLGTVVQIDQLEQFVVDAKKGVVTFRVNGQGLLNAPLGKLDQNDDLQIMSNFKTFIDLLVAKKPEKVKSKYFQQVILKSTMGPPIKIKVEYIDPRNKSCLINEF